MWPFHKPKEVTLEDIFAYLNETPTGKAVVEYLNDQKIKIEQKPLDDLAGRYYTDRIEIDSRRCLQDQALTLAHETVHACQTNDRERQASYDSLRVRGSNWKYVVIKNNEKLYDEAEADYVRDIILSERAEKGLKNEFGMVFIESYLIHGLQKKIIGGLAATFYKIRNQSLLDALPSKAERELLINSARNRALFGYERFVKQTGFNELLVWRVPYASRTSSTIAG